jgi:NAD(P)-dependent dehydrogenase (short-subunit alcohol dehydrogenase family)
MTRIDGATALVTGGQRGLGEALVEALLRRGATKVSS